MVERLWSWAVVVLLATAACGDAKHQDDDDDDSSSQAGDDGSGGKGAAGGKGGSAGKTSSGGKSSTGGVTGTGGSADGGTDTGGTGETGGSATGGAGGNGASAGTGGSDPPPTPTCDLDAIEADATLNWDLRTITVGGVITVNGAPMPDSPDLADRGTITFSDKRTGHSYTDALPATGDASFSSLLFAGDFDVTFEAPTESALVGLPLGGTKRLALDVSITEDQALNFDLKPVTVSGAVTLNGAAMPDSPGLTNRGVLTFRDQQTGGSYGFAVPATGAATYTRLMFAGDYDVTFKSDGTSGLVGLPISATTRVATNVGVTGDQTLNYDLKTATVGGTVTLNGAPVPDSTDLTHRGVIEFRDKATYYSYGAGIGATGAGVYSRFMFAGDFEVTFVTDSSSSLVGLPIGRSTLIGAAVTIQDDQTLDYDLKTVAMSGTVTVNGAVMPDSPDVQSRGVVTFRDPLTGETYSNGVGVNGAGLYSGVIFAGIYDVGFDSDTSSDLLGLPIGRSTRLGTSIAMSADEALNYDLKTATVTGVVTVNGSAMPDSPDVTTRGTITFRDKLTAESYTSSVAATGDAAYSHVLFAGVYDVSFEAVSESGLVGLPFGGETRVGSNVVVSADSSLDYDLEPVTVSGRITVNGAAMPDSPEVTTRGLITFLDKMTGHAYAGSILPTGEGSYSHSLFAGGFDVSFEAVSESGLMGMPYGGEAALAQGCLPTMPCAEDPSDLTGTWTLYFDETHFGPLTIALSQDGAALSGPYQAPTYGGVFQGTRSGNAIDLSTNIPSSCAPFRLKATLGSACLLEGSATCGGFPTLNPRFTGLR